MMPSDGLDSEYPEEDWLSLSGIQHYSFCKRQWALIHIEQLWNENYLTASGRVEHQRVDDYSQSEMRGDVLTIRGMRVFSRRLGVTGICDVVEFHRSEQGVPVQGRDGLWTVFPIEYKHGARKVGDADRLQLCAEAMCLEEMLLCSIPQGALFYHKTRRREFVELDESLRTTVCADFRQMHLLLAKGTTPSAKVTQACDDCSLRNLCLPELTKKKSAREYVSTRLRELAIDDQTNA
ncbi:MAG: CRISPR-associated protein Cas4 [Bifidobacteriaceae bacterium]|nr:CRISPR-associated protein Cas4 [Bifidobacteriaceae bacterium]